MLSLQAQSSDEFASSAEPRVGTPVEHWDGGVGVSEASNSRLIFRSSGGELVSNAQQRIIPLALPEQHVSPTQHRIRRGDVAIRRRKLALVHRHGTLLE